MVTETKAHTFDREMDRKWINGNFIRFCVVRDPILRFESSYGYNLQWASKKSIGLNLKMTEHGLLDDINDYCRAIQEQPSDFMKFAQVKPQSVFIRRGKPQIILRHHRLKQDLKIIYRLLDSPPPTLERINVTTKKKLALTANLALSTESKEFLRSFYEDDYKMLGY